MNGREPSDKRREKGAGLCNEIAPPQPTGKNQSRDVGPWAGWAAASLAGLVSVVLAARTPFFKSMQKRIAPQMAGAADSRRRVKKPHANQSLPMLAEAIIGNTRGAIADVFGFPRSAVLCGSASAATPAERAAVTAETWYYALERDEPLAMAIEIDQDWARHVEFFKAPRA